MLSPADEWPVESIAALGARIAEIQARVAGLVPSAPAAPGAFAARLSAALRAGEGGAPALRSGSAVGSPSASAPGSALIDGWIDRAIAETGVPADWAPHIKTIAQHESGYNPYAYNGDDPVGDGRTQRVAGLMQMLQTTFEAHAAPGRADIYNPVDNLVAAIRYIKGRYGDAANVPGVKALAAGGSYRGY